MKIRIHLPGEEEATCTLVSPDVNHMTENNGDAGNAIFEVEPSFWDTKASPNVLALEVLDEKSNVIQRILLRVSGITGKLKVIDRSKSVKPHYEKELYGTEDEEDEDDGDVETEEDDEDVSLIPRSRKP